jgi:hypothetical protein
MKNIKVFEDFSENASEGHNHRDNYMFFQHLRTIKDAAESLLSMDEEQLDSLLSNGHAWAVDHVTTAADDIEEVYHFVKNRMSDEVVSVSVDSIEVEEPAEEEDE